MLCVSIANPLLLLGGILRVGGGVVQSLSHVQLFEIPWTTARQAFLSFTISWSLFNLMSIESVMPSNHLILCCPLLLLPSVFPSISLFQWVSSSHHWPKYWSFSFSISPFNEYSGLISSRIDWFDLCCPRDCQESSLAPQFESINSFGAQPSLWSNYHIPTWLREKTMALTRWIFVSKVMSLLFNTLSLS